MVATGQWAFRRSKVLSPISLVSMADGEIPLTLKGTATQTGNLFEARRGSDNTLLANIHPTNGQMTLLAGLNVGVNSGGTVSTDYLVSTNRLVVNGTTGHLWFSGGSSNNSHGSGALSGGTVTVSNTMVTANSKIFLQATGGTAGYLTRGAITPATGFVVTGSAADTTFDYFIINSF